MDDIVVLGWSKPFLRRVHDRMEDKLRELGLEINPNWQIFPIEDRGVDFAGYRTFRDYSLLRKRIKSNMKAKMAMLRKLLRDQSHEPTASDLGVWAAYKGILDHCDSFRLARRYVKPVGKILERRLCQQHSIQASPTR
jgi:hypothetical protein